jgi:hypothetical protein
MEPMTMRTIPMPTDIMLENRTLDLMVDCGLFLINRVSRAPNNDPNMPETKKHIPVNSIPKPALFSIVFFTYVPPSIEPMILRTKPTRIDHIFRHSVFGLLTLMLAGFA